MKKYLPILFFLCISVVFSWKFFVHGSVPVPADALVGLYHPYRDYYAQNYPNGMPFKNFLITDPIRQQYPWRHLVVDEIKKGNMPTWNPYSFSGTPLAGNYQSAPYYPLNILFLILPFEIAWSVLVIIQPFLAGWFMYLFLAIYCRTREAKLIGAISFAFSSVVISWFTWNTLVHTFLWLPLALFAFEKVAINSKALTRKTILYGFLLFVSFASILLAGHAQMALYALSLFILYSIFKILPLKKFNGTLVITTLVAIGLAGICAFSQLSELFYFVGYSNRSVDMGNVTQEGWFVPLSHLIQFVAPDFFGNPATLNYWGTWNYGELTGYVGVITLVFALFGLFFSKNKIKTMFIIALCLGLLFSIRNPIAELPFKLAIPFLSTSQPTRLLFVCIFSLVALSSFGVEEFIANAKGRYRVLYILLGMLLLFGLLWSSVLTGNNLFNLADFITNIDIAKRNLYLPTLLFIISGVLMCLSIFYQSKRPKVNLFVLPILIVVLLFDLFRFGWKFTPFVPAEYLYPETKLFHYMSEQADLFRIMTLDNRILPPNVTIPYKIQTIDGYDPLYLKNYGELASSIVRNKPDISPFSFNRIITIQQVDNKFIDFMNVKYVLSLTDVVNPKLVKVFEEGQTKVYENSQVFPRAFFVRNIRVASSKQEAIDYLYDPALDLRTTAVTYENVPVSSEKLTENEKAEIIDYENSRVTMTVSTEKTRLLILSDVYYPKWKAFVDGKETKIYEVNYAFRGVVIEPGTHILTFKYL